MFTAGAHREGGHVRWCNCSTRPDQGDLASFKAQADRWGSCRSIAPSSLPRASSVRRRPSIRRRPTYDQANAGIAKTQAIISQKLVRAPFDGELGVRHVEVGQFLTAGTQIVTLTDLSTLYANFTVTEKDSAPAQGRADRARRGRRLSGPEFRGQDHHHRAADRDRYAQHPRSGHDRQSRSHPEARHVHDHDGGAAGQAAGRHRSRDRGRLHAVRRFGFPASPRRRRTTARPA